MIQFPGLSSRAVDVEVTEGCYLRAPRSPFSSPAIPSFTGIKSLAEGSLQGVSGAGSRCLQAGQGISNPCAINGPRWYFSDNIKL